MKKIVVIDEALYDSIIKHREPNYISLTLKTKYGVEPAYWAWDNHEIIKYLNEKYNGRDYELCTIIDENKLTCLLLEHSAAILQILEIDETGKIH